MILVWYKPLIESAVIQLYFFLYMPWNDHCMNEWMNEWIMHECKPRAMRWCLNKQSVWQYALTTLPSLLSHLLRNFTQGPVNMYNCQVVMVSASTFENNRAQSVFTDLPSRLSGGGLSITIYGKSNSFVVQGTFNYTIQNCTFYNNSANSTVPTASTISILEGGYVNGRGGGVAFYVVQPLVVLIKVLQCNFTNNSAYIGGGLYILSSVPFTEEDFTIAGNHFEENGAVNGGGIHLGIISQNTDGKEFMYKDVTESVTFCRNKFVKNTAKFGGAMLLVRGQWTIRYNVYWLSFLRFDGCDGTCVYVLYYVSENASTVWYTCCSLIVLYWLAVTMHSPTLTHSLSLSLSLSLTHTHTHTHIQTYTQDYFWSQFHLMSLMK